MAKISTAFFALLYSLFSIKFSEKMGMHDIFNSTKDYKISSKFAGMRDETVIGVIYFETDYN